MEEDAARIVLVLIARVLVVVAALTFYARSTEERHEAKIADRNRWSHTGNRIGTLA